MNSVRFVNIWFHLYAGSTGWPAPAFMSIDWSLLSVDGCRKKFAGQLWRCPKQGIPSSRPGRSRGGGGSIDLLDSLLFSSGFLDSKSFGFGGHVDDEGDEDIDEVVYVDERW